MTVLGATSLVLPLAKIFTPAGVYVAGNCAGVIWKPNGTGAPLAATNLG
jgi:hypothetical protein